MNRERDRAKIIGRGKEACREGGLGAGGPKLEAVCEEESPGSSSSSSSTTPPSSLPPSLPLSLPPSSAHAINDTWELQWVAARLSLLFYYYPQLCFCCQCAGAERGAGLSEGGGRSQGRARWCVQHCAGAAVALAAVLCSTRHVLVPYREATTRRRAHPVLLSKQLLRPRLRQ